jgi:hypothetical protein
MSAFMLAVSICPLSALVCMMSTLGNLRLYDFNLPISMYPCLPAVCPCLSVPACLEFSPVYLPLSIDADYPYLQYFVPVCLRLPASICPCLPAAYTCVYLPLSACSLHLSSLISRRYILRRFFLLQDRKKGRIHEIRGVRALCTVKQ